MRFRVRRKGRAGHISVPEKPEKKAVPLKAADLDNPYGRVFGTPAAGKTCANKQERPLRQCRRGRFGYRPKSRCVSCKKKRAGVEGVTF